MKKELEDKIKKVLKDRGIDWDKECIDSLVKAIGEAVLSEMPKKIEKYYDGCKYVTYQHQFAWNELHDKLTEILETK